MKQIEIDVEVHRAIEQARRSFSERENDILRRMLLAEVSVSSAPRGKPHAAAPVARQRGIWTVEFLQKRLPAANLKDAYRTLLVQLVEHDGGFLQRFANESSRSRRYVARAASELYVSSPHLATNYAKPLVDEWFFDSNLSLEQVGRRARAAARVAGLSYGKDMRILENLKEI